MFTYPNDYNVIASEKQCNKMYYKQKLFRESLSISINFKADAHFYFQMKVLLWVNALIENETQKIETDL